MCQAPRVALSFLMYSLTSCSFSVEITSVPTCFSELNRHASAEEGKRKRNPTWWIFFIKISSPNNRTYNKYTPLNCSLSQMTLLDRKLPCSRNWRREYRAESKGNEGGWGLEDPCIEEKSEWKEKKKWCVFFGGECKRSSPSDCFREVERFRRFM